LFFLITITIILYTMYYSRVDNTVTKEDIVYINKILNENNIKEYNGVSYYDEIEFIKKVLDVIYLIAPSGVGLPINETREPKDLFLIGRGACFDKSRVIEKILNLNGFKTRHISSYLNEKNFKVLTLLTKNITSHAATEVYTKKGWIVLGTYDKWMSLDSKNMPISSNEIRNNLNSNILWKYKLPKNLDYYYSYKGSEMIIVYGLYSRHGKFYPPYNFIPDIEWNEFIYNFTEYFND